MVGPFCLFWKVRNKIVFNDEFFSLQGEKTSLVFLLWIEAKKIYTRWPFKYSWVD